MKKQIILGLFLCLTGMLNAQIGIGTITPSATAILEVQSTTRGLLIPRMTSSQRGAIVSPAPGLIIYNTTTNCLNYYVAPNWFESCGVGISFPAALGSTFTSFSNGAPSNENFSANTSCQSKLISAGHNAQTCTGSVNGVSNTYNVVLINGQCWINSNLNETSTSPCSATINTGCNTWLNTVPGDIGSWGYYNVTTPNGSAGWSTTQPGPAEGLLYQWSAAMNGSMAERAQGVCPTGWHIPSNCEWMYLEHGLGMSIAQQNATNDRTTTGEGSKLSPLTQSGTNSSGFTALFPGTRNTDGTYFGRAIGSYFWTSSEFFSTQAYRRGLVNTSTGVDNANFDKGASFSVRCLKD